MIETDNETLKGNELSSYKKTWNNLKCILLSEKGQSEELSSYKETWNNLKCILLSEKGQSEKAQQ